MRRVMLLLGGTGCAVARAVVYAACAGAWAGETELLLVDNGAAAAQAAQVAQMVEQYGRLRACMEQVPGQRLGFTAPLHLHTWPHALPAQSLNQWAASEEDKLLCRALFPEKVAAQDLSGDLSGCDAAARAVFAALLEKAAPLSLGEDDRLLLVGSLADGWGAAGVDAFARCYRHSGAQVASLLLMPYAGQDEHAHRRAEEALRGLARSETVYLLGTSESDCASADPACANLVEWLACCCGDSFFRAQVPPVGLMTYRVAAGRLGWESFPGAYRVCYGSLVKTAAAFCVTFEPFIRRSLSSPSWLRDRLRGWYAGYFRRAAVEGEDCRAELMQDLDCAMNLLRGCLGWMSAMLRNMPPLLRSSSAMEQARHAAAENYRQYIDVAGQLAMLRQEAQESGLLEEKIVHRHKGETDEAEQLQQLFARMEEKKQALAQQQESHNRRIGGPAQLLMMKSLLGDLRAQSENLHAQASEAQRRIDEAALIAAPEEQHRIATARTKLKRLQRYVSQVDACMLIVRLERDKARESGVHRRPPELAEAEALPENGLFSPKGLDSLLALQDRDAKSARRAASEAEQAFPGLVLPVKGGEGTLSELISRLRPEDGPASPVAALLRDTMLTMAKEVH